MTIAALPITSSARVEQPVSIESFRERVELLEAENRQLRALLNDGRRLTTRAIRLLNGSRSPA